MIEINESDSVEFIWMIGISATDSTVIGFLTIGAQQRSQWTFKKAAAFLALLDSVSGRTIRRSIEFGNFPGKYFDIFVLFYSHGCQPFFFHFDRFYLNVFMAMLVFAVSNGACFKTPATNSDGIDTFFPFLFFNKFDAKVSSCDFDGINKIQNELNSLVRSFFYDEVHLSSATNAPAMKIALAI